MNNDFSTFLGEMQITNGNNQFILKVGYNYYFNKIRKREYGLYFILSTIDRKDIMGMWVTSIYNYLHNIPDRHIEKGINEKLLSIVKIQAKKFDKLKVFA